MSTVDDAKLRKAIIRYCETNHIDLLAVRLSKDFCQTLVDHLLSRKLLFPETSEVRRAQSNKKMITLLRNIVYRMRTRDGSVLSSSSVAPITSKYEMPLAEEKREDSVVSGGPGDESAGREREMQPQGDTQSEAVNLNEPPLEVSESTPSHPVHTDMSLARLIPGITPLSSEPAPADNVHSYEPQLHGLHASASPHDNLEEIGNHNIMKDSSSSPLVGKVKRKIPRIYSSTSSSHFSSPFAKNKTPQLPTSQGIGASPATDFVSPKSSSPIKIFKSKHYSSSVSYSPPTDSFEPRRNATHSPSKTPERAPISSDMGSTPVSFVSDDGPGSDGSLLMEHSDADSCDEDCSLDEHSVRRRYRHDRCKNLGHFSFGSCKSLLDTGYRRSGILEKLREHGVEC